MQSVRIAWASRPICRFERFVVVESAWSVDSCNLKYAPAMRGLVELFVGRRVEPTIAGTLASSTHAHLAVLRLAVLPLPIPQSFDVLH